MFELRCDFTACGARYKTRPGLNYHLSHNHIGGFGPSDDLASQSPKQTPPATPGIQTIIVWCQCTASSRRT